jgi:hypothetical protein
MGHTPGPWEVFICDDGGKWTGWPLSINPGYDENKSVVRTGGQWPYEWDSKTSQDEAVANALLISAAPDLLEALESLIRSNSPEHINAAIDAVAKARGTTNET